MKRNEACDPIPAKFPGETAVLLATGPSLTKEQITLIRPYHEAGRIRVFGLNDAYRICDFMDVLYACDPKWWDLNPDVFKNPCKEKWTQDKRAAAKYKLLLVSGSSGRGLSKKANHIHYGSNSGFQLLNLAYHYGIRKFLLVGYNMGATDNQNKGQHFFGRHPKGLNQSNNYAGFVSQYQSIVPEDQNMIYNCTFPSNLMKVFRSIELEKALEGKFGDCQPKQAAAKKPAVPRKPRKAPVQRVRRNPSRNRPVPKPRPVRHFIPRPYGGAV